MWICDFLVPQIGYGYRYRVKKFGDRVWNECLRSKLDALSFLGRFLSSSTTPTTLPLLTTHHSHLRRRVTATHCRNPGNKPLLLPRESSPYCCLGVILPWPLLLLMFVKEIKARWKLSVHTKHKTTVTSTNHVLHFNDKKFRERPVSIPCSFLVSSQDEFISIVHSFIPIYTFNLSIF